MSKVPFWKPPGLVTRPMPVVRFEGVDPQSAEAHMLAKAFGPQIRQFYLKQASAHAAGIVDQSRGQRQFGDGLHMSYTNQFGAEVVNVRVAPQVVEKVMQPVKRPWDWVVFEITVSPVGTGAPAPVGASFWAERVIPRPREPGVADPVWDDGPEYDDALSPPVLAFPHSVGPGGVIVPDDRSLDTASLRIDMRRFNQSPGSAVSVDIYGILGAATQQAPYEYVQVYAGSSGYAYAYLGETRYLFAAPQAPTIDDRWLYQPSLMYPASGFPDSVLVADVPAAPMTLEVQPADVHAHIDNIQYDPASGLVTSYVHHQGEEAFSHMDGLYQVNDFYDKYTTFYYDIETRTVPELVPTTLEATCQFTAGFGEPPQNNTRFDALRDDYYRWLNVEQLPFTMSTLRPAEPPVVSTEEYRKLGRLIINPMDQAISFKTINEAVPWSW